MSDKPLGHKAYGSIPHLPGSRTGPSDHTITEGQARICTERPRDKHDTIVVQEKLDGSNCSVARIGNNVVALGRAGHLAQSSKYEMHQRFAAWVREREWLFGQLLNDGERICGEWLLQAHGTRYAPIPTNELFRPFDIILGQTERSLTIDVGSRATDYGLRPVTTLHVGGPLAISEALIALETSPHSLPTADRSLREGCVWRVERHGKVDFLAKYVRPEKVDGIYLNGEPCWNNR